MRPVLRIGKALSDATRVRALLALRAGELCLCQLIRLLGRSPATVSKHMDILREAGLVERRREGRWSHFRLAGRNAEPAVQQALRWVCATLADDATIVRDARRVARLRGLDLRELAACYKS